MTRGRPLLSAYHFSLLPLVTQFRISWNRVILVRCTREVSRSMYLLTMDEGVLRQSIWTTTLEEWTNFRFRSGCRPLGRRSPCQ